MFHPLNTAISLRIRWYIEVSKDGEERNPHEEVDGVEDVEEVETGHERDEVEEGGDS